ncbi:hypothetical protein D3C71_2021450 [compost metagenome]
MSWPSSGFGVTGSFFVTGAEAPAGFASLTTVNSFLPDAAGNPVSKDLIEVKRQSAFAGTLTNESS